MNGLTLFQAVLTVVGVFCLAYYCSRLLGKQWGKASVSQNMQVVEHIQVGQNQKLLILQVGGQYYLLGVSKDGIQLLTRLDGEFSAPEAVLPGPEQPPFQELLKKYLTPRQKKGGEGDE